MGAQFNNIDLHETKYSGLGVNIGLGLYNDNSNNFTYSLGVQSGAKDQMDAFNAASNQPIYLPHAAGYGKTLPTTPSAIPQAISVIGSALNSAKKAIINFFK